MMTGNHAAPTARSATGCVRTFFEQAPAIVTTASDVAEVVWRAANDASGQLRFPAGPDAVALAAAQLTAQADAWSV